MAFKKFACSSILSKILKNPSFFPTFDLDSELWHHFCTHFLHIKICLTISLSILNSSAIILMPQQLSFLKQSSPFPHLQQFSLFLDSEIICYLPHPSFWKTSCALLRRHLLHMPQVINQRFWWHFSSISEEIWCLLIADFFTPSTDTARQHMIWHVTGARLRNN